MLRSGAGRSSRWNSFHRIFRSPSSGAGFRACWDPHPENSFDPFPILFATMKIDPRRCNMLPAPLLFEASSVRRMEPRCRSSRWHRSRRIEAMSAPNDLFGEHLGLANVISLEYTNIPGVLPAEAQSEAQQALFRASVTFDSRAWGVCCLRGKGDPERPEFSLRKTSKSRENLSKISRRCSQLERPGLGRISKLVRCRRW